MTPVYVQGHGSDIIREAVRALRHVPPTGSVLILLGWLSLAFGGQRWFVLVSTLGYPSVALGSAFFLLMAGAIMLLHAGQLLLAPGVTVPEPPAVASRLRRLWRVTLAELAVMGGIGIALGLADAAGSSQLARFAAQHLVWRDAFAGLPSPASAWLVAWCTY